MNYNSFIFRWIEYNLKSFIRKNISKANQLSQKRKAIVLMPNMHAVFILNFLKKNDIFNSYKLS